MKKIFIVIAVMLAAGIYAAAMADTTRIPEPRPGEKYRILLKSGGTLETDSYRVDKDTNTVKIAIPAGTISINISEIKGEQNSGSVQEIFRQPEPAPAQQPAPSRGPSNTESSRAKKPGQEQAYEERDDNGHTEEWWKVRVKDLQDKKIKAQKQYQDAEAEWNKYNGLLGPFVNMTGAGGISNFQQIQYQDLRGSARVRMDQAREELTKIEKSLEVDLPDEARKAGAPPGWVR